MQSTIQRALGVLYPAQCLICDERLTSEGAFCGRCRGELPDITGTICDCCGTPLIGPETSTRELCDTCLDETPPWTKGRAAWVYDGTARRFVLLFKHSDRTDLAKPAAQWMLRASRGLLTPDSLLVPVPLHWTRMFRRRYNQAALLSTELAKLSGCDHVPDLLKRTRSAGKMTNHSRRQRRTTLSGAIATSPRRAQLARDRQVVLVDDVMTSGATLRACAAALQDAGALRVDMLVLARAVKET